MTERRNRRRSCPSKSCRFLFGVAALIAALLAAQQLQAQPVSPEEPRALTERGEQNLLAYSNLVGLVRYFHPSDQASRLDWDRFVVSTVEEVEAAHNAEDLLDVFGRLTGPVAPTARFFLTGQPPPNALPPRGPDTRPIAWRHYGLQTGAPRSGFHFDSRRVGGFEPPPAGEVFRYLDRAPAAGETIRFRAAARSSLPAMQGAEIWLAARGDQDQPLAESRQRIGGTTWKLYSTELRIPPGTRDVLFGLRLLAADSAWIDEGSIDRRDGAGVVHPTASFPFDEEVPGGIPAGWSQPPASRAAGVQAGIHNTASYRGKGSLQLRKAGPEKEGGPEPERPVIADLGAGVSIVLPVAVYADRNGTLPHDSGSSQPDVVSKPSSLQPSGDHRATRLANVVLLSAALTRFYPHSEGRRALAEAIVPALRSAASDPDARRFHDTLRRFVSVLKDGHADVMHLSDWRRFRLPLLWNWVEGRLIVTWADPGIPQVKRGDLVIEIDGVPSERALLEAEALVSGATPAYRRHRALEYLVAGNQEQERKLLLRRDSGTTVEVVLRCTAPAFGLASPRRENPAKVAELKPGVFYLDLDRIDNQNFLATLPKLQDAAGIIFDLRGYPASVSPRLFLAPLLSRPVLGETTIPVVTRPDQPELLDTRRVFLSPEGPKLKARVVFLTDERAVSLAENLLQIVTENRLATLIGSPTAGTQGEINEMVLPGGFFVLWTGTRDGWGAAIEPLIPVRPTLAGISAGHDEVLAAALASFGSP